MKKKSHSPVSGRKFVLICGNVNRELAMLQLLKRELVDTLDAKVWIIGSLADIQKTYYTLNRIKPEVVFVSQIVETVTRDLAKYVRKSGAILCVLPVELYYLKNEYFRLFKRQPYNKYVDYYFLPGLKMYKDIVRYSDIDRDKLFLTGSPKIDLYVNKHAKKFLSRKQFHRKFAIENSNKNIFIFSSFIVTAPDYVRKEKAFKSEIKYILKRNEGMVRMREIFTRDIKNLCSDFPKCNIILKLHPLEENFIYGNIDAKNFYVIKDISFNDTLNSIDLAVYWRSTIATECWINGIKTLQYIPLKDRGILLGDFTSENPVFYNYPSLEGGILKYLDNSLEQNYLVAQKQYLKFWYYKTDGQSVKRIANQLKKNLRITPIITPNFKFTGNLSIHLFVCLEKILGIKLSRKLVSFLYKDYSWEYAAGNYIFDPPSGDREHGY